MFCGLFIISTLNFAILTRVHGVTPTYDVLHSLWNEFYMPSWMRITPYFVGVAAGYFNHKFNDKLRINRVSLKIEHFKCMNDPDDNDFNFRKIVYYYG